MLLTYTLYYPSKAPRSLICVSRSSFIPKSSMQVTDRVHCWGCRQPVPRDGNRSQGTEHNPSCSTAAWPCPRPSAPWTELPSPPALPSSRAAPCSTRACREGCPRAGVPTCLQDLPTSPDTCLLPDCSRVSPGQERRTKVTTETAVWSSPES